MFGGEGCDGVEVTDTKIARNLDWRFWHFISLCLLDFRTLVSRFISVQNRRLVAAINLKVLMGYVCLISDYGELPF